MSNIPIDLLMDISENGFHSCYFIGNSYRKSYLITMFKFKDAIYEFISDEDGSIIQIVIKFKNGHVYSHDI